MHGDSQGLLLELRDVIGDAYEIVRELHGGGMSHVFLATERSLGRQVVVKVLPPEMVSGVSQARFQREILVTASLQHPHILPVLAAGGRGDLHYYVAPFIEGQSLRERLSLQGALPIDDGLAILRELAGALAHAHARGIIHRDVKPENVLLSEGHAVLADFGIASACERATLGERLTAAGVGPGTPGYMAPEQLVDATSADARVDVYALGVVAYEIFTGHAPFAGRKAGATFIETPVSIGQLVPALPRNVAAAIMRALATVADDRFPNAGDFLAAIRPAHEDARRPAGGRRRTVAIIAAVVVLASLASVPAVRARLSASSNERGRASGGAGSVDRKMLAVLPFKNLGPPEDAYFADGVTEEITSRLASLPGLGVISRTSADQYARSTKPLRTIANELGADYVLEGSVRWERTGTGRGRVRVTPQLIRVRDDTHLWSFPYETELKDVFMVQTEIAEKVAGALAVAIPGAQLRQMSARPTENLAAYDLYMQGEQLRLRQNNSRGALARAERLFAEATSADPRFALAFAKLALMHVRMYESFMDRSRRRLELARGAADSALALDPGLPEARVALGSYYEGTDDLVRARAEFAQAEQLRPNDSEILVSSGQVMARLGSWDEGTRRYLRAAELDPRSTRVNIGAAVALGYQRDTRRALAFVERAIAADSEALDAYTTKARLQLLIAGDRAGARATARDMILRFGAERVATAEGFEEVAPAVDTTDLAALERVSISSFAGNAVLFHYWRVGLFDSWQPQRARAHADTLRRLGEPLLAAEPDSWRVHSAIGYLSSLLGDRGAAITAMERALALMPRQRDAVVWSELSFIGARTLVNVGEHERAIDLLEQILNYPGWISVAFLRSDPFWAPLRSNPRFQRLLSRGS